MSHTTIATTAQLARLLDKMRQSSWVGLDTEFISESRYQPQLCLIQVAFEDGLALIDPLALSENECRPFWQFLCEEEREILVHSGRSELEFCFKAVGQIPQSVFDVQLAAGFVGLDFPASFSLLTQNLLHLNLPKGETRTDWRKRPLSERQLEYALNDVRPLYDLAKKLQSRLKNLRRLNWFHEESLQTGQVLQRTWSQPKWKETAKCRTLSAREQGIVRELWIWRDHLAKRTNQVTSRILRDDLLIAIAKLKSADIQRIESIRGMERSSLVGQYREISAAVERGLSLDVEELPQPTDQQNIPQYQIMVQLLYAVLQMICKQHCIATSLVGSQTDVRELIAHVLGTLPDGITPRLSQSWRAELLNGSLEPILLGKMALRLNPKRPEEPLVFAD